MCRPLTLASQGAAPAEAMINSLVQCQLSYINTIDPNFVGGTSAIAMVRLSRALFAPTRC